jgi:hypothetical protein
VARVAQFVPESGSTGFILLRQGFFGGWKFAYSADGRGSGSVPLDWATVAAYDAAGQLSWKKERSVFSLASHERQVPGLAFALAKRCGLGEQIRSPWSLDPDSTMVRQFILFGVFFAAGGLPTLAIVAGVLHLLAHRAMGSLLGLSGTGAYTLSEGYVTALRRRRAGFGYR